MPILCRAAGCINSLTKHEPRGARDYAVTARIPSQLPQIRFERTSVIAHHCTPLFAWTANVAETNSDVSVATSTEQRMQFPIAAPGADVVVN